MNKLGKLEKVPLRGYWKSEPRNFTTWLSERDNLDLLGDTIGISIETEQIEASAGDFNADILAKDEDGNYVIIENQLEETDHKHLGQIITYASVKEAKTIVWIARKFRDEHRKAVEWLNEHTDDEINIFAIEIELWKIGNSDCAAKFSIVEKPNEWVKILKKSQKTNETSETELKRLNFWAGLKDYAVENNIKYFTHKASKDHWFNISMGISGSYLSLTISFQNNKITCSFWIDDDKEFFDSLESNKNDIEKDLGYKLNWDRKPNKKASCIIIEKTNDFSIGENEMAYKWLTEKVIEFKKVFGDYIKKINV